MEFSLDFDLDVELIVISGPSQLPYQGTFKVYVNDELESVCKKFTEKIGSKPHRIYTWRNTLDHECFAVVLPGISEKEA